MYFCIFIYKDIRTCIFSLSYSLAILVVIFWNFTILQYISDSAQVKRNLITSIAKLVYELPHELPNNLRLRIFRNQEILKKYKSQIDTQPSVQSPFKNLNFANSSYKTPKNRYQTFLFLSSFTGLLHFIPKNLSGIVDKLCKVYRCSVIIDFI